MIDIKGGGSGGPSSIEKLSDAFKMAEVFKAVAIDEQMLELKSSTLTSQQMLEKFGGDMKPVLEQVKAKLTADLIDKMMESTGLKPKEQTTFMGMKIVSSPYLPEGMATLISDGHPNSMGVVMYDGQPAILMNEADFDKTHDDPAALMKILKPAMPAHIQALDDKFDKIVADVENEILFGTSVLDDAVAGLSPLSPKSMKTLEEFKAKYGSEAFKKEYTNAFEQLVNSTDDGEEIPIETGNLAFFDEGGVAPKEVWFEGEKFTSFSVDAKQFGDAVPKHQFVVQGKPMQNFSIEYPVETKPFGDGYAQKIAALPNKLPITVKFTTPVSKAALEDGAAVPELGQKIHIGDPAYGIDGQFVITNLVKDYDIANAQYLFEVTALEVLGLDSKQLPGKIEVDPKVFATEGDEVYGGTHTGSWKSKHGQPQTIPKPKIFHPKGKEFGASQLSIVATKLMNGVIKPDRVTMANSMVSQGHPKCKLTAKQWEYIDRFAAGVYDIGAEADPRKKAIADTPAWADKSITLVDMPDDMQKLKELFEYLAVQNDTKFPTCHLLLCGVSIWVYRVAAETHYVLRVQDGDGKKVGVLRGNGDFVYQWKGPPDLMPHDRLVEELSLAIQDPIAAVAEHLKVMGGG